MLFNFKAITNTGEKKDGSVDAGTRDLAISAVQRRGLIVVSIVEAEKDKSFFDMTLFEHVPTKDVVILSRQIATLFESQVSALKAFTLLSNNVENKLLARTLVKITDDLQAGTSISVALSKYPDIFSDFYVNMVHAGEESGKLSQIFSYLADYLDRQYQLNSKAKNALIYPSFVIGIFFIVMAVMFVFIVPKLGQIIKESGQDIPFHTKMVLGLSDLFVNYGIFILAFLVGIAFYIFHLTRTDSGKSYLDKVKISIPVFKTIFIKLYLSRVADNLDTMLSSGIPIIRAIDITASVVGNRVYSRILKQAAEEVKAGKPLSDALAVHPEIPAIMSQMIKVGEETGSVGNILSTLGRFYNREAKEAVDTLVTLIEPVMIVALGLGVGILLSSVLMPIYNIAGGIQ